MPGNVCKHLPCFQGIFSQSKYLIALTKNFMEILTILNMKNIFSTSTLTPIGFITKNTKWAIYKEFNESVYLLKILMELF